MPPVASFLNEIDQTNLPRHIAVIMDGNGRWALKKGASRLFGHKNAIQAITDVATGCGELGVEYLTLYAFSTENWGRPKEEVDGLMELLVNTLKKEISMLQEKNVKLQVIGEISSLPENCQKNLLYAIAETAGNTGLNLIVALSYSGRWEITRAMQEIAHEIAEGRLKPDEINEKLIADHLNTAKIPDPELLIRSGGEMRVSNFLLWQIAYTELFITQKLWPDFRKEDLYEAILAFQQRERRFGKVTEKPRLKAS